MPTSIKIVFRQRDGRVVEAIGKIGQSVRDVAISSGVAGIPGECGGNCACGTCHVQVSDDWIELVGLVEPDSIEDATLDFSSNRGVNSRLSCQIPVRPELDGLVVSVGNDL